MVKKFGVTPLPREFNPQALGNVTPHYSWHIDPSKLNTTGPDVMQKLADTGQSVSVAWAPGRAARADAIQTRLRLTTMAVVMVLPETRIPSALRSSNSKRARTS